ncbi:MAG: excinuclease ABC subunit UvrC [Flavobacteriaceae bacterium]
MKTPSLEIQIKTLPASAGVYQFYDTEEKLLYVGKAKNLKKRVRSYFTKTHDHNRTRLLVKKISRIKHIVVSSEMDALLLENNLIKTYQPRYNVMLKDDKTYPWLCIKNEAFPRIFLTRKMIRDGSEYFGPFTSVKTVRALLDLIKTLYPLRTCKYDLSQEKIASQKYKVCLEYHLGNCAAPCVGKMATDEYNNNLQVIRQIIKGNFKNALKLFKEKMVQHAEAMEFEAAQLIKEKINILENYQAKTTVVNAKIDNVDVFTVFSDETYGYINFLQIAHGAIIRSHTLEIKKKLDETDAQLLALALIEIRQRFDSISPTVYTNIPLKINTDLEILQPKIGDKKALIDLSLRNAKYFRMERFKQIKIVDPERHEKRIVNQIKSDLRLAVAPQHIECFDNSNIQGTNPVAACVVFRNGKPSKKEYRHYNIKTVVGPDDFASMEEVVYRRYKRLRDEAQPMPQLIVIDGGKGQLSAALKSLDALELRGKIAIIGIAKRLEELFFPNDPIPLYLDKKSETLKVIQQLRNEAHRFGISFHRNKRSKSALVSELDQIQGIGPKTRAQLLKVFKSLKRIKEATPEELTAVVGPKKAKLFFEAFQKNTTN